MIELNRIRGQTETTDRTGDRGSTTGLNGWTSTLLP